MAKTVYKKKVKNGKEYYFYRFRHKNLRTPKDIYAVTVKDLEKKIKTLNTELDNNIVNSSEFFDTFFTEWLFNVKFIHLKPSTKTLYESVYRTYIKDCELSDIKIKEISAVYVQKYYSNLTKKGVTPHTIVSINKLITPCIKYAYNTNIIIKDFTSAIVLPKEDEKTKLSKENKIHPFTLQEQKKFLSVIKGAKNEALFLTALYSGLRQGELLALTWNDINFKESYIQVNKTVAEVADVTPEGRGKLKRILQTPKTKSSIRKVDIPKILVSILKHHKLNQAQHKLKDNDRYEDNNLVFCTKYGKFINSRNLRQLFKDILKENDIKDRKFHDLRHTYATRLFELGEREKTVQKLMGHSNIAVTMNTYTHVLDNIKEKAVSKLDGLAHIMETV